NISSYLAANGFSTQTLPPLRWVSLNQQLSVMSIPVPIDDSLIVVDTPHAVILDINDSKVDPITAAKLSRMLDRKFKGKTRILLASYSAASIVNCFVKNGRRFPMYERAVFIQAVVRACRLLKADYYLPFASQAVFRRRDTVW